MRKSQSKYSYIGLDVGARAVRAVQLERSGGDWKLRAMAQVPHQVDDSVRPVLPAGLASTLKRRGFMGRSVVSSVPSERLLSGVLELPPASSAAPRGQIAQTELAAMHKADPSAMELAYWAMPSNGRKRETSRVMAVGCPHDIAERALDAIEAAGLDPVALDIEPVALARVTLGGRAKPQTVTALLDLGMSACLLVVAAGDTVIYERRLTEFGLSALWAKLSDSLSLEEDLVRTLVHGVGLSDEPPEQPLDPVVVGDIRSAIRDHYDELIRETNISVSYARHQCPDSDETQLLITGHGARIPHLDVQMHKWMETPASVAVPSDRFESPSSLSRLSGDPSMTLAAGLAMWEGGRDRD